MARRVFSSAVLAAVATASAVLPAAAGARADTTAAPSIGNLCMVGTWRSGVTTYLTSFHGVILSMEGLRGTTETDAVTGRSVTSWRHASVARTMLYGHEVKEKVRGSVVSQLHAGVYSGYLRYTANVPHHIVETFTYRHHTTVRHPHHLPVQRTPYTCTATSYTTPAGQSTRVTQPTKSAALAR